MRNQSMGLLFSLLRIKSVSTQEKYMPEMQKARDFLLKLFTEMGFDTKIFPGHTHPAVFAQLMTNDQRPTALIYGHYDVQPPEPLDQWKTPSFEPTVIGGKIYCRGATDNKGQLMIHIMAIKKLIEKYDKDLPLNIKFLIEGEEEIGSPSIISIVKKYKKLLQADYIIVSDSEMPYPDQPSIDISLRGLVYTQVTVTTASQDVHSGQFGGLAENPAIVLTRIINRLKDSQNKILIPGFYDDVTAPSKKELKDYESLKVTEKQIEKEGSLYITGGGEENLSINERRWGRPTLDINGFLSGYTEEGSKTIIPASAMAKISMRLVPNQNPDKIYDLFSEYVTKICPKDINLKIESLAGALPFKADTSHPVFSFAKESLKRAFGKEALFTGVGGSIGAIPLLASALNAPVLMIGFGLPDENLHSPNEHFSLGNYEKGILAMTHLYQNIFRVDKQKKSLI